MTDTDLKRSPLPFSPLKDREIPFRHTLAAMDYALTNGGVDHKQAARITFDYERRALIDLADHEDRAMTHAGALGAIDALHIEWGSTDRDDFDQLVFWERLGRILRTAGI